MRVRRLAHRARHKHGAQEQQPLDGVGLGQNQRDEGDHRIRAPQPLQVSRSVAQEAQVPRFQRVLCCSQQGLYYLLQQ